jgi:hypothetical protein
METVYLGYLTRLHLVAHSRLHRQAKAMLMGWTEHGWPSSVTLIPHQFDKLQNPWKQIAGTAGRIFTGKLPRHTGRYEVSCRREQNPFPIPKPLAVTLKL